MLSVTFSSFVQSSACGGPTSKEAVIKVLEELVEAIRECEACNKPLDDMGIADLSSWELSRRAVLDDAMDVSQALADLLVDEFSDDEIVEAYERCVKRNRERGRL